MHIELRHLTKKFGSTAVLNNISGSMPAGQIVAMIGLNGAGKTTLLRCLAGILAPTRGEILYDGEPFTRGRLDMRRRLVFLPDFPSLYGQMNPLQHVALMFRVFERDFPDVVDQTIGVLRELDMLPLAEVPVNRLSRGQYYKAALAGLLAVRPELWLLDEPFASGLDPQGLSVLKQRARQAAAAGATVIYTTQILEIAEKFCDRLCVIDHGGLRADFSRVELDALPASGPESIESRLQQFRETP